MRVLISVADPLLGTIQSAEIEDQLAPGVPPEAHALKLFGCDNMKWEGMYEVETPKGVYTYMIGSPLESSKIVTVVKQGSILPF